MATFTADQITFARHDGTLDRQIFRVDLGDFGAPGHAPQRLHQVVAAKTSEDDLRSLRSSIDATPEVVSALKAKGLSSSQVVAINIVDGVMTLFAKTA